MNHAIVSREEVAVRGPQGASRQGARPNPTNSTRSAPSAGRCPGSKIEKPYVFEGSEGACTLGNEPVPRPQPARRLSFHALTPGSDHVVPRLLVHGRSCGCGAPAIPSMPSCRSPRSSRVPLRRIEEGQEPDGLDILLGFLAGQRLQLRFRHVVHARGHCRRPLIYNYGTSDAEEPRHVRRERLREG